MNQHEQIWRGTETVGRQPGRQPGRTFPIFTRDFSSVEQAVPIPVIYGTPKPFAGVIVTPIFGFRSVQITTEMSK